MNTDRNADRAWGPDAEAGAEPESPALPAWKRELQARLAAHRERRPVVGFAAGHASAVAEEDAGSRAALVASRVAERYARAPSYSEMLAASAAAAAAAAETAALAARESQEAAEALARLAAESSVGEEAERLGGQQAGACSDAGAGEGSVADQCGLTDAMGRRRVDAGGGEAGLGTGLGTGLGAALGTGLGASSEANLGVSGSGMAAGFRFEGHTVAYPEPLPARGVVPPRPAGPEARCAGGGIVDAFAEAMVSPAVSLPAKLIEFPRELIAARKVRPRIAEGPLLVEEEGGWLRIFEVEGEEDAEGALASSSQAGEQGEGLSASQQEAPGSGLGQAELDQSELDQSERDQSERDRVERDWASRQGQQPRMYGEAGSGEPEATEGRRHLPAALPAALPEKFSEQVRPARRPARGSQSAPAASQTAGWQAIRLGEHPASEPSGSEVPAAAARPLPRVGPGVQTGAQPGLPAVALHPATLGDRAMAALVDLSIVAGGFLLFVLIFAACTTHPPVTKGALLAGAGVFVGLLLFYEWLFLSYGLATPGMRYARIALCTFDDANPTRQVRQRRVWASALAALPIGLGVLWALFDEEALGWHDRMSRTYQRSYR